MQGPLSAALFWSPSGSPAVMAAAEVMGPAAEAMVVGWDTGSDIEVVECD